MKTFRLIFLLVIYGWFTYISFDGLLEWTDSRKIAYSFSPIIGILVATLVGISLKLNDINDKLK